MEPINQEAGKFTSCKGKSVQSVWGHFNYDTERGCQITTYHEPWNNGNWTANLNEITLAETETIKFEGNNSQVAFFECYPENSHSNKFTENNYTSPIAIEHHGIEFESQLRDIKFSSMEFNLAHFRDWIGWRKLWDVEDIMGNLKSYVKIIDRIMEKDPRVIMEKPFRVELLLDLSNCPVNKSPNQWADVTVKFDFSATTEGSYTYHDAIRSVAIFQAIISCILRVSCPIYKIGGKIAGVQGALANVRLLIKNGSYRTRHIDPNLLDFGKQTFYYPREYYQPDLILSDENYGKLLRSLLGNRKLNTQDSNDRLRVLLHISDYYLNESDNLFLYQKLFEGCKDICVSIRGEQGIKKGDKFCCLRCRRKINFDDTYGLQPAHICDIISPELEQTILDIIDEGVLTLLFCNYRELRNDIAHYKKDAVLGSNVGLVFVMLLSLQFIALEYIFEGVKFERPEDHFKMIFKGVKKFLSEKEVQNGQ